MASLMGKHTRSFSSLSVPVCESTGSEGAVCMFLPTDVCVLFILPGLPGWVSIPLCFIPFSVCLFVCFPSHFTSSVLFTVSVYCDFFSELVFCTLNSLRKVYHSNSTHTKESFHWGKKKKTIWRCSNDYYLQSCTCGSLTKSDVCRLLSRVTK